MRGQARVLVAMSGGVDSSVAAARLLDQGFEVTGVTLRLVAEPTPSMPAGAGAAIADAERVADRLGIEHQVVDCVEPFERLVVEPFVGAYLAGRTPSPCARCNRHLKVAQLIALADRFGIEQIATGHYARIGTSALGRSTLRRGCDLGKDQSYFLCLLPERWLARLLLPLGDSTKEQVRAEAADRALPVAFKAESQELCFAPEGYLSFIERRAAGRIRPGWILDAQGRRLARHGGVHRFTCGQRKGLGVALGYPAFVTHVDSESGSVTVGPLEQSMAMGARLGAGRWDTELRFPADLVVKVRSQHRGAPARLERATVSPNGELGTVLVRFREPVAGVSPGQLAVAYDGDRVLGGASIEEIIREEIGGSLGP